METRCKPCSYPLHLQRGVRERAGNWFCFIHVSEPEEATGISTALHVAEKTPHQFL